MRESVRCRFLVIVFWCFTLPFWGLDVPLKYVRLPNRNNIEFHVASVKVADFDLLAPDAKPAVFQIDLGTSDAAKGLIRVERGETNTVNVAGRECRNGSFTSFKVDDPTSACSKGNLYVLVDYYDSAPTTGTRLTLGYDSFESGRFNFRTMAEPLTLTNTNTWKRHQFRLPNAFFGNRSGGKYDFFLSAEPEAVFTPSNSSQSPKKMLSLPPGKWKLPAQVKQSATVSEDGWVVVTEQTTPKKPFYVYAKFGDKQRLMMVGYQKPESVFYDRIYFDANGNGDLTDDKVLDGKAQVTTGSMTSRFDAVDTTIEVNGKTLPFSFAAGVSCYSQGPNEFVNLEYSVHFGISTNCYYSGEFESEGKRYLVALGDYDSNGRFDDRLNGRDSSYSYIGENRVAYMSGDRFYMTQESKPTDEDSQILGERLLLGTRMYDVAIDTADGKMSLIPTTVTLVSVNLPTATKKLEIYTSDQKHAIMAYDPPGKQIQVPEGDYCLHSYTLLRNDAQGDLWRLTARGSSEATSVTAAKSPCALVYGEPFTPQVFMPEWVMGNIRNGSKRADLGLSIEGIGKELVSDLTHLSGTLTQCELSSKDPTRPKEPSWRIAKADGEIVAQGKFEYG